MSYFLFKCEVYIAIFIVMYEYTYSGSIMSLFKSSNNDPKVPSVPSIPFDKSDLGKLIIGHSEEKKGQEKEPPYHLIAMDAPSSAEPIRLMLYIFNYEFSETRLSDADLKMIENYLPLRRVPVLKYYQYSLYKSVAICRFIARLNGLASTISEENLMTDITIGLITDLRKEIETYVVEATITELKKSKRDILMQNTIPFYLKIFEEFIGEKGYFYNAKLFWVDVYFVGMMSYFNHMMGFDLFADYPKLKSLKKRIFEIPAVKIKMEHQSQGIESTSKDDIKLTVLDD